MRIDATVCKNIFACMRLVIAEKCCKAFDTFLWLYQLKVSALADTGSALNCFCVSIVPYLSNRCYDAGGMM